MLLSLIAGCTTAPVVPQAPEPAPTSTPSPTAPIPQRVIGVTLDDPWNTKPIVEALKKLSKPIWVRVVFDPGIKASEYQPVLTALKPHVAGIMGELLDSVEVKKCDLKCYEKRTLDYLKLQDVDVLEGCNEINGGTDDNWLGAGAAVKCALALRLAKAQGKKTAMTLYWQPDVAMFNWVEKNLTAADRKNIDWVLVSVYAKDNKDKAGKGQYPDWATLWPRLKGLFPDAQLGLGEVGDDRSKAAAQAEWNYYYRDGKADHPLSFGGYFWWYMQALFGKNPYLFESLKAL